MRDQHEHVWLTMEDGRTCLVCDERSDTSRDDTFNQTDTILSIHLGPEGSG